MIKSFASLIQYLKDSFITKADSNLKKYNLMEEIFKKNRNLVQLVNSS